MVLRVRLPCANPMSSACLPREIPKSPPARRAASHNTTVRLATLPRRSARNPRSIDQLHTSGQVRMCATRARRESYRGCQPAVSMFAHPGCRSRYPGVRDQASRALAHLGLSMELGPCARR
jgi:hypothetical protein